MDGPWDCIVKILLLGRPEFENSGLRTPRDLHPCSKPTNYNTDELNEVIPYFSERRLRKGERFPSPFRGSFGRESRRNTVFRNSDNGPRHLNGINEFSIEI